MIAAGSLVSQMILLVCAIKNSLRGDGAFCFSKDAVAMDRETTKPMVTQSIPIVS